MFTNPHADPQHARHRSVRTHSRRNFFHSRRLSGARSCGHIFPLKDFVSTVESTTGSSNTLVALASAITLLIDQSHNAIVRSQESLFTELGTISSCCLLTHTISPFLCVNHCYKSNILTACPVLHSLIADFLFSATGSLFACIDFTRAADDAPSSDSP